jgi:hypothetical protein
MRRWGPVLAIACVLLVGAITLAGVARNRAGQPDADVVLTERELSLPQWLPEENTGVSLRIEWSGPGGAAQEDGAWLDRSKLESLGFDCRFPVEAPSAQEHYSRMLPREAVLVLEFDGEAAKRWIAATERQQSELMSKIAEEADPAAREKRAADARKAVESARESATRLFVVDAGLDAAELRRRYPDRSTHVLAKGIVRIAADPAGAEKLAKPARLHGRVNVLLVSAIQVPRDQRSLLDSLVASDRKAREAAKPETTPAAPRPRSGTTPHPPRYRVHVRWGHRLEPWIVAVEPL